MKKFLVILLTMLVASGAYGQGHHSGHGSHHGQHHKTENVHQGNKHHGNNGAHHSSHGSNGHGRSHGYYNLPAETECQFEWQELWNGCHVRLLGDRVHVVNRRGDTVVSGERVFLTSNGRYEVKNGGIWSVRDADGGFTTLSGMDICYWSEGFYGIKVGSFWRLYYEDGDFVGNVWGEHITIYENNLIRAERNGYYYYYDYEGNERR